MSGLFDWLFPTADSDDLPGDDDDRDVRDFVAESTAGACQHPQDVIADWGSFYGDTPIEEQNDCKNDPEAYYDSCIKIDVRIVGDDETNAIMDEFDDRRYGKQ